VNFKKGLTYGNNPKMIILHHADEENCSIEDINQDKGCCRHPG